MPMISRATFFLGLGVAFCIGVLLGQPGQRSKLTKYLQPGTGTAMQIATLSAEVDMIRAGLPISGDTGLGPPQVSFDQKSFTFNIDTLVTDELLKKPVSQVRAILLAFSETWLKDVQSYIPEASKSNFRVHFQDFSTEALKAGISRDFAVYSNGELTLK
jgi:hypothetical protein